MKRIERIRLYPTVRQAAALRFMLDVTRELYNAALQERRDAYRLRGVSVTFKMQYAELTALRRPESWLDGRLAAVYRECEDAVLHRLELAMQAFFRRCKAGETPGFPRFKPRGALEATAVPARGPGAEVRCRTSSACGYRAWAASSCAKDAGCRPSAGRGWSSGNGRWYASFECERAVKPLPKTGRLIGIDRGVHVLAATSDGQLIRNLAVGEKRKRATARLQRELEAVTERDGAGRVHQPARSKRDRGRCCGWLAPKSAKPTPGATTRTSGTGQIVNGADVIALEALRLRNMTRSAKGSIQQPGRRVAAKAGLNRVVLDAGFGLLHRLIAEKAEEAARRVVLVDPVSRRKSVRSAG